MSSYFYVDPNGLQAGPVAANIIVEMISTDVTLGWKEGMSDWTPFGDVPEIKSLLEKKKASPPPPPPRPSVRGSTESKPNPPPPSNISNPPPSSKISATSEFENKGASINDIGWIEKFTVDKVPYYYHSTTESVSWDKPDSLKSAAEKESSEGEWVWITDEKEVYLPASIKSRSGNSVNVVLMNGSKKTVTAGPTEPLWPLSKSSLTRLVDDMVMVESLNHAQMLYLLKERYNQDCIYTWVGASHSVLVSINPFKQLPIYTVNIMANFSHTSPNRLDPPHTFAIANSAFNNMRNNSKNQAILISGESGAGKTEATKQCFNFLAEIAGSELQLEQKILNSNPVLESFGNAKTLRNNNSSRFGRWTEISFSSRGQIIGASIENYLLEKSRVVQVGRGERSYHIFYQLCLCMAGPLSLDSPESFRYLSGSGCSTAEGIDDREEFVTLKEAFHHLDFSDQDVQWVFECCAGILHLSNITFLARDEGSVINPQSQNSVRHAATFLKVDPAKLSNALCSHTIEVRSEFSSILHKPKEAQEATDALSKALYSNMFNWLVMRINKSVKGVKGHFIGVLDIFGFEIFEKNGFEQLCINFTNEKLQQHFNSHTFKEEEQTYLSEEVPYEPVAFIDNQPVLDLIEKKPHGLLNLLDEEVRLPKGDDAKWLSKCASNHASHPNWVSDRSRLNQHGASSFMINHYAGSVIYDSTNFCDKNRDNVFRDLYDLMSQANHKNYKELFPEKDNNPRRMETLGGYFRKQLTNLMTVCDTTEPHYIRCIKPNQEKKPKLFNTRICLEQLTYAGVFEAVQIRKTGYPFRLTHSRFAGRYRPLLKTKQGRVAVVNSGGGAVDVCRTILNSINQNFSKVAIGNTMILYRAEEHRILELLRNLCLDRVIPVAQRMARKFVGRKFLKALKFIKKTCQPALQDGNDSDWLDEVIQKSQNAISPFRPVFSFESYDLVKAKDRRFKLQERVLLNIEMLKLVKMDPLQYFDQFVNAIKRSDAILDMPGTTEDVVVETKVRTKLRDAAGAKIDPWAADVLFLLEKKTMEQCLAEAKVYNYTSNDLEEIQRLLSLPEDKFVRLQLKRANEIGDKDRVVNREIRLKDIFLDMYGQLFDFSASCPQLRNPMDWAYSKFFGLSMNKNAMAMGFLQHTEVPIHQSLTKLDDAVDSKSAVKAFKNLMGFMGDRKYNYPESLALEYVSTGISGGNNIRIELYYQIMKQLSNNPSSASSTKGWEMMAIILSCFPPPESIENIVAMFLKQNAPRDIVQKYRVALHSIVYSGARTVSPTIEQIVEISKDFKSREFDEKFLSMDVLTVKDRNEREEPTPVLVSSKPTPNPVAPAAAAAPPPPPPPPKNQVLQGKILYDYAGETGGLQVRQGEIVTIADATNADWWLVTTASGGNGWAPASYIGKL